MTLKQGVFNRHEEIRLALRFFLQSYHKIRQQGAVPDKAAVLHDFQRYKGLTPVVDRLCITRPRQVKPAPEGQQ